MILNIQEYDCNTYVGHTACATLIRVNYSMNYLFLYFSSKVYHHIYLFLNLPYFFMAYLTILSAGLPTQRRIMWRLVDNRLERMGNEVVKA
jgi:hypothetical protein